MSFIKLYFVEEVDRMAVCNKIPGSGKPQTLTPMIQTHVNFQARFQPNAHVRILVQKKGNAYSTVTFVIYYKYYCA